MDVCRRLFVAAGNDPRAFCFVPRAAVTHESSPGPYRRTLQDRAWYVVARDNVYFACRHAGPLRGVFGSLLLQTALPAQLPPGLQLWMQLWVPDAGAPQGLAATNALRLVLP